MLIIHSLKSCSNCHLYQELVEMVDTGCADVIIIQRFLLSLQTMLTAISMSAIATNGVVPGKYWDNEKSHNGLTTADYII